MLYLITCVNIFPMFRFIVKEYFQKTRREWYLYINILPCIKVLFDLVCFESTHDGSRFSLILCFGMISDRAQGIIWVSKGLTWDGFRQGKHLTLCSISLSPINILKYYLDSQYINIHSDFQGEFIIDPPYSLSVMSQENMDGSAIMFISQVSVKEIVNQPTYN